MARASKSSGKAKKKAGPGKSDLVKSNLVKSSPAKRPEEQTGSAPLSSSKELVIITGISGSGKGSALKALEDLGYYAVDHLPLELLPDFAALVQSSPEQGLSEIDKAVIVVDVREGPSLELLPTILLKVKKAIRTSVVFLDASDAVLVRRFSETRRPHPLSR